MKAQSRVFSGRIIFDHLPKTAGQAVNAWLTKSLGSGCVTPNLNGRHQELIRRYGGEYSIISGHVEFQGAGLDPRYGYITCLREPIDRAISWLFFVTKNHEMTQLPGLWQQVEEFITTDGYGDQEFLAAISNLYVEHFSNVISLEPRSDEQKLADAFSALEQYSVWGLYEEMPAFVKTMAALIGLSSSAQFERVNVTRVRPLVEKLSPRLRRRIEQLNTLDMEFYRVLRERWRRETLHRPTISLPERSDWDVYNPVRERVFAIQEFQLISAILQGGDTFSRGEILRFDVEFSLAMSVENLEIGIHIFDDYGNRAFGTNTVMLSRQLAVGRGTHNIRFYLVADLPEGQYTAGFGLAERCSERNSTIAWYDKLITFKVMVPRTIASVGYVSLPVEFEYRKISDNAIRFFENAAGTISLVLPIGEICVGDCLDVSVRLENASNEVWVSMGLHPINFSYHWLNGAGEPVVFEGERTPLPVGEVFPGQSIMGVMRLIAPPAPGHYGLVLSPVQEGRFWFDARGFTPLVLEVDVVVAGEAREYSGADVRLRSQVGQRQGLAIETTGQEGFLLFGPYINLSKGMYFARLEGQVEDVGGGIWADVTADKGSKVLVAKAVTKTQQKRIVELSFELQESVDDLEVRLWVGSGARARVDVLRIERIGAVLDVRSVS